MVKKFVNVTHPGEGLVIPRVARHNGTLATMCPWRCQEEWNWTYNHKRKKEIEEEEWKKVRKVEEIMEDTSIWKEVDNKKKEVASPPLYTEQNDSSSI